MSYRLVLLTAGFPYGNGETFLENEIPILARYFDKIDIISINPEDTVSRAIPENVELHTVIIKNKLPRVLKIIQSLGSAKFWQELKVVKKTYNKRYTNELIKIALKSFINGISIRHFLLKNIPKKALDSTIFYSYWCDDAALALAQLKRAGNIRKAVCRVHGWDLEMERHPQQYLPFRQLIANSLDLIFPVSDYGKNYIQKTWKIEHPEKIKVSYLGVPPAKSTLKISKRQHRVIVSCSNLIPLKRVELIIEALCRIENISIEWIHFGDGPLMNELKEMAKTMLPNIIRANWQGQKNNSEIMDFYANQRPDLFLNVSISEGLPVSMMEAASYGIPILATNVGGVSEIVQDGVNGKLLSANLTSEELAEEIKIILNLSEVQISRMGEASLKVWEEKFHAEKTFMEFCREVLN